jgi:hypothetical protein
MSGQAEAPVTVLITADASTRSRALATRYSVPLLLKPFDLDELVTVLTRAQQENLRPSRVP